MPEVDLFQEHRRRLFAVAYRMLGSASDAEDVVQDAWLRFSAARPSDLRSPQAYLTTIVTRLCLDRLKSARAAREEYIGPWLPEPVLTDDREEPEQSVALAESVTLAFMVLLETLSPEERAVFLLREVFDHEYDEIAAMLDMTPANCRQLFHRAKLHIADRRPRYHDTARGEASAGRPLRQRPARRRRRRADQRARRGRRLLERRRRQGLRRAPPDLRPRSRRAGAGRDPAHGALGRHRARGRDAGRGRGEPRAVGGAARFGPDRSVYTFSIENDAIAAIRIMRNPDKLRFLERQLSSEQ